MSASDVILRKLVKQAETIRRLRLENWRLRQSRDNWKRKHNARSKQNTALRRQLKRQQARRKPATPGIYLSEHDLQRILSMPPHCDR